MKARFGWICVNLVLVASEFNAPIPDQMVEVAKAKAKSLGARVVEVVRVPGIWEIPLAVRTLLGRKEVDAAVAIGAVVTGESTCSASSPSPSRWASRAQA